LGGGICKVSSLSPPPAMLVNMYTFKIGSQGDCESVDMQTLSIVWDEINVCVCTNTSEADLESVRGNLYVTLRCVLLLHCYA
jgi:hypothetical protein